MFRTRNWMYFLPALCLRFSISLDAIEERKTLFRWSIISECNDLSTPAAPRPRALVEYSVAIGPGFFLAFLFLYGNILQHANEYGANLPGVALQIEARGNTTLRSTEERPNLNGPRETREGDVLPFLTLDALKAPGILWSLFPSFFLLYPPKIFSAERAQAQSISITYGSDHVQGAHADFRTRLRVNAAVTTRGR
ncbi:hypothetical protein F5146DRAFT_1125327 [Armillaria mellea]|nr:hypothetical protein F5146DRAFT_1125327 [Armillaria mellea]